MAAPPRVLFLTLYPGSVASPRYRVSQFIPHLESAGFDCTVASALDDQRYAALKQPGVRPFHYHAAETFNRVRQILSASRYDCVFVQKAVMTAYVRGMPSLLRMYAPKLVVDIDDAVHVQPPHPLRGAARILEDRRQLEKIMRAADLVLAGNEWLREAAAEWSLNAVTFPTVVDTERFVPAPANDRPFRVGWIGGPSTFGYVNDLNGALDQAAGALFLVGAPPDAVPWPKATCAAWSPETEVALTQSFSAGIMPLRNDDWCRGKCGLKALQYMACGVPCIATPWGAANDIIRDGENGLFADTPEAWRAAIERIRDPAERKRLGNAGRATVESKYSLKTAAPRLVELLRSVL